MAAVGEPLTLARGKLALAFYITCCFIACRKCKYIYFLVILTDVKRAIELLEKLQKSKSYFKTILNSCYCKSCYPQCWSIYIKYL
jgi:hypothetical protein